MHVGAQTPHQWSDYRRTNGMGNIWSMGAFDTTPSAFAWSSLRGAIVQTNSWSSWYPEHSRWKLSLVVSSDHRPRSHVSDSIQMVSDTRALCTGKPHRRWDNPHDLCISQAYLCQRLTVLCRWLESVGLASLKRISSRLFLFPLFLTISVLHQEPIKLV